MLERSSIFLFLQGKVKESKNSWQQIELSLKVNWQLHSAFGLAQLDLDLQENMQWLFFLFFLSLTPLLAARD